MLTTTQLLMQVFGSSVEDIELMDVVFYDGDSDAILGIDFAYNGDTGREEIRYAFSPDGEEVLGQFFSVRGIVRARPQYQQFILSSCREAMMEAPNPRFTSKLQRAIEKA